MNDHCPFRYGLRQFSKLLNHSVQNPSLISSTLSEQRFGWRRGATVGRDINPPRLLITFRVTSQILVCSPRACKTYHCLHITHTHHMAPCLLSQILRTPVWVSPRSLYTRSAN